MVSRVATSGTSLSLWFRTDESHRSCLARSHRDVGSYRGRCGGCELRRQHWASADRVPHRGDLRAGEGDCRDRAPPARLVDPTGGLMHYCTVCSRDSAVHPSACLESACEGVPHWPSLCCPGCECVSYE